MIDKAKHDKAEISQPKEGLEPATLALVRIADALDCLVAAAWSINDLLEKKTTEEE